MSAQPQVNAATCGTEVTSLLRILEAPEIRTAYVKKLKPYEVTIVNLALGGALYGKTKYLVDKGQNPADHSSNYILGSCGSRLPVCGGGCQRKAKRCQEREFHTRRKRLCVSSTTNLFKCLNILRKRWSVKLRRYQDSLQQPGSKASGRSYTLVVHLHSSKNKGKRTR